MSSLTRLTPTDQHCDAHRQAPATWALWDKGEDEPHLLCDKCAQRELALQRWFARRHPMAYIVLVFVCLGGGAFSFTKALGPTGTPIVDSGYQMSAAIMLFASMMFFGLWVYGVEKEK